MPYLGAEEGKGTEPMLTLTINGEPITLDTPPTITEMIAVRGIQPQRVAVAVNAEVVPRASWGQTVLQPGDRVDLVRAISGGSQENDDPLVIASVPFASRLFLGTGRFPSPQVLRDALIASSTELVTVSIRSLGLDGRGADGGLTDELDLSRYRLLPNTAGATSVRQAVYMAHLAREATNTNWVKLEVIGDERTLWPDPMGTVEACKKLVADGFIVLAYTSGDLVTALRLQDAGAASVMPLASMIGSGQGIQDRDSIQRIVERLSVPIVVDAGIGAPSDAAIAMELGADACLVNTAISRSGDPVLMARAMKCSVEAGRMAFRAGRMPRLNDAVPSSPVIGIVHAPAHDTAAALPRG